MQEKLFKSINDKLESLIDNNPQVNSFKRQAKVLHKKLKEEYQSKNKKDFIPLRQCQDLVAQQNGYKHWHEFHTNIKKLYVEIQESSLIKYDNKKAPSFNSKLYPVHVGYNAQLGTQAWLDYDSLKKHVLIQNNDDSSKLELNLIDTSIKNGDHIVYMGSNSAEIEQVRQLAIQSGREKDIRTISFMTNYEKYEDTNWYFPKNLPYSSGTITELIVSMLDDTSKNHISSNIKAPYAWKGHAISLLSSVIMALVYIRDQDDVVLSLETIREYLLFDNIKNLLKTRNDLPQHIKQSFITYLNSVPHYVESADKQIESFMDFHGHTQMQITKVLGSIEYHMEHLFKGGENKLEATDRINQLTGVNHNLIFLITYPNFNKAEELSLISYFTINLIKCNLITKLGQSIAYPVLEDKKIVKTTWIIKDTPLPRGFAIIPAQAIAMKTQLILSYKSLSDNAWFDEKKKIEDSCHIKAHDFQLVQNNKIQYKLIINNQEENLIL